jgi:hypothetical protein
MTPTINIGNRRPRPQPHRVPAPALLQGQLLPPRLWYTHAPPSCNRCFDSVITHLTPNISNPPIGASPFSCLVYPLPEAAGLGVHATVDLGGQTRFGPDVEWVDDPGKIVKNGCLYVYESIEALSDFPFLYAYAQRT